MKIQILVDNINSWYIKYAKQLVHEQKKNGHNAVLLNRHEDIEQGDILCLLACKKKFKKLHLNRYNLVVHESDLPQGKGWSPLTWQVLEGKNKIPVTLFEAGQKVDSGKIYAQDFILLEGHELIDEIREKQGIITNNLILNFVNGLPKVKSYKQVGQETYYPKRTPKNSELNINKSILEQFNLLRVVDNERYPSFFYKDGIKYVLKIHKEK